MSAEAMEEAVLLLCGLDVGFFDYGDIVKWSDRQIALTESPSNELLDLSMIQISNTHQTDVHNLLGTLVSTNSTMRIHVKLGLIGVMLEKQMITVREAMSRLWLLKDEPGITSEHESKIYGLDVEYDLALERTYGRPEDVDQELRDFVMPYAQQITDRYPQLFAE